MSIIGSSIRNSILIIVVSSTGRCIVSSVVSSVVNNIGSIIGNNAGNSIGISILV